MFHVTHTSIARAALAAAAMALFASHAAWASQPRKEMSYWADAQTASRATGHSAQLASRATDAREHSVFASRAGERADGSDAAQA